MPTQLTSFAEYILNVIFHHLSGITIRAMFGGYGLYKDGVVFALIADEKLYFKVDESNQIWYESQGSKPFTYAKGKHKPTTMSYWEVSEEMMGDEELIKKLVNESYQISLKKKKVKTNI